MEGSGLKVREQNFNFDLLSRESLLRKFLGKDIQVIETHYISGKKTIENAKVLSVDAGLVLKIGDRIETDYSGRLIFPDIPANLYDQPTLTVNVAADDSGKRDIELSYLTNGLTWRADYVAELNDAEDALNLNGWVTLTNTSGIAYNNADIQFVAGSVNRVRPPAVPRPMMLKARNMAFAESASAGDAMIEEQLMDYHLYSLGRKTDIASNQTKQLALLSASDVKVKKNTNLPILCPFTGDAAVPANLTCAAPTSFYNSTMTRRPIWDYLCPAALSAFTKPIQNRICSLSAKTESITFPKTAKSSLIWAALLT